MCLIWEMTWNHICRSPKPEHLHNFQIKLTDGPSGCWHFVVSKIWMNHLERFECKWSEVCNMSDCVFSNQVREWFTWGGHTNQKQIQEPVERSVTVRSKNRDSFHCFQTFQRKKGDICFAESFSVTFKFLSFIHLFNLTS